jgi:hypothetical protein
MAYSIHLYQELSLDSLAGLILPLTTIASHGVNFINEDDAGLFLSSHLEQCLHNLFTLPDIFAHDVTARYTEKC